MIAGIVLAALVSLLWIIAQNLWMHWRPAANRFGAMLAGYLVSLPALWIGLRLLPATTGESPWLAVVHTHVFHLLLFFCYVECFYHVERSVSLRLLVEILLAGPAGIRLESVRAQYSHADMIRERLQVMVARGLLRCDDGVYRLQPKARAFAQVVAFAAWVYQAKAQHERS